MTLVFILVIIEIHFFLIFSSFFTRNLTNIFKFSVITSQLFVEKKSHFLKSIPEHVQELWNKWELRLAVLCSLFFQILLISLGDRRKRTKKIWIQIILWIAYLCADWVAAVALGILSHNIEVPKTRELPSFWAPFLLLHLGGPDTITAYSLEDNELWLRHFLGLGVQGGIASYVSYKSWTGTIVSILSVLMYVPAIVKYGERTWVLSSASKERLRDSMLDPPDPGPNYAKFMDEYNSKDEEGYRVTIGRIEEKTIQQVPAAVPAVGQSDPGTTEAEVLDAEILPKGYYFFQIYKRLFAFLIISFEDWNESKSYFQQISPQKAFSLIDVELGFMFDVLYTKAIIVRSLKGTILRSISFFFTVFVFIMFLNADRKHKQHKQHKQHPSTDLIITYLLLAVAIILDIYAAIILITSDSGYLWLRKHSMDSLAKKLLGWRCRCKRTRWSNSVAQYNLLRIWLNDKPSRFRKLLQSLGIHKKLRNSFYTNYKPVSRDLEFLIFQQLQRKSFRANDFNIAKRLCLSRGSDVLQQLDIDRRQQNIESHLYDRLKWSIDDIEFDQSILIWHIATDLCCHHSGRVPEEQEKNCKLLSDYMVYLLIVCPFMLPEGIGEIRSVDTEEEAMIFFREKNLEQDLKGKIEGAIKKACEALLTVKTDIPPIEVKGPKSKSVLFDACRLANLLGQLEWKMKWETISLVWVEMLSYAAAQCKGPSHAKQLGQGGELLTHVWLLMAHFGITEQFQMPTGFARKLIYR
ncbi:hypothetical protein NE237_010267 [Protea cynaroides]|uniref:DUF4220 domain-containing protein n=1 Tax=Protea cynaroides TaxID=273540 RepID=A0A9Q0KZD9_9MAGN|nr:hypothetical protein NE237_010267 [Protea cynaroides]